MMDALRNRLGRVFRSGAGEAHGPLLSMVLIVYDMPEQARNTVRSLLPDYQAGVRGDEYEVLIVENASDNTMDREFIAGLPANFIYHLREETQPTPIHACNYGVEKARGRNICVMIDGARVLTPGVVRNTILGHRLSGRAVVTVPGYHLGHELQQNAVGSGYSVAVEQQLMGSIGWPQDGYRLFEIACFSGSCAAGFYLPHSESNCISMPRPLWRELGGFDPGFDKRGGGVVNLDLYKRACEHPGTQHVFLHGEGTFHQFHGGVTTGGEDGEVRQRFIDEIMEQYRQIRGRKFESPVTDPLYLGQVPDAALPFFQLSANKKLQRLNAQSEAERALA